MKPYIALFRIRLVNSIQYRAAALAGISTQFAWGFMLILSFMAFYESNPHAFPMTMQQTVSFMWMQQAFLTLFFLWFYDYTIFESVESGYISYDLVRPMDLYNRWFTTSIANRLARAALRCAPVLIVGSILPAPFRMIWPGNLLQLAAFIFSMMLSVVVVVCISMLVYVSSFFTIRSTGTRSIVAIAGDFLSGAIIPVPFFPDALRRVVELSPFGAMQNLPLRIFVGHVYGAELMQSLGLQVFWIVVLVAVGRFFMKKAIKRVVAQGG